MERKDHSHSEPIITTDDTEAQYSPLEEEFIAADIDASTAGVGKVTMAPQRRWTPELIRQEATLFYQTHGVVSSRVLAHAGESGLSAAIFRYYPGKMQQLRQDIGTPGPKSPGYWSKMPHDELLARAREILMAHGEISSNTLHNMGESGLAEAIRHYYPGGMRQVKKDLGKGPGAQWTEDNIRAEAEAFLQMHGELTNAALKAQQRGGFARAIARYYPGGITQLKEELGVTNKSDNSEQEQLVIAREALRRVRREHIQEVQQQARAIVEEHGDFTKRLLSKHRREDVIKIVEGYPGGVTKLRRDLGIEAATKTPWSTSLIIEQARKFLASHDAISHRLLQNAHQVGLSGAIKRIYPGGMRQLRQDLGLETMHRKPKGSWTVEQIEVEAEMVYRAEQQFTFKLLRELGRYDLWNAIRRNYPGGILELRKNIGAIESQSKKQEIVSPEDANKELLQFLEVESE
jgi:hypothetical protein